MADDLSVLLDNTGKSDNFSDITFIVSDQEIPAHRCILSARSDYFRAMFNNSMRESHTSQPIQINSVEYNVFKIVMQYIYCGRFLNEEEIDAVMLVSTFAILQYRRWLRKFQDNLYLEATYEVAFPPILSILLEAKA